MNPKKADIWSYGIILWELVSGEDITSYQPFSISRQMGAGASGRALSLPARCPAIARRIFTACTQMDPEKRPTAFQLVEWLRADAAGGSAGGAGSAAATAAPGAGVGGGGGEGKR
jgi:serine/threonine protein kinase